MVPAEAQVIGEYEWEFEEEGGSCYAGILSHSADARFQLAIENDQIAGFLITKDAELSTVKIEQKLRVTGRFDSGEEIALGQIVLVGRKPFEFGSSDEWAYFMFTEPERTGDKRMMYGETLTIYAEGLPNDPEDYTLGTFPLNGSKEVLTEFAHCAVQ
jgi:hypothetical protein